MRTSLTRAIAGTAIAAAAVLTVVGTAGAATSTTSVKAPTTLSLTEARATIVVGQKDVLTGTLRTGSKPVAGKAVWLYRYGVHAKRWIPVYGLFTGKLGHVFFVVRPAATTAYELLFHGTPMFAASRSNLAIVRVVPAKAPTTLGIAVSSRSITAGQKDLIKGTLLTGTKPVAGKGVWLFRYGTEAKKWIAVKGLVTGKFGHVFYTVKPSVTTSYRLVFFGTLHLRPSVSDVTTITVTQ